MIKLKVDHVSVMLKYLVQIADPVFTCNVFDPLEPCFVLASKRILSKLCSLHD